MNFQRSWREVLIEQILIALLAIPAILSMFWLMSCILLLLGPLIVFGVILEALYKEGFLIILAVPISLAVVFGITVVAYGFSLFLDIYDTEGSSIYYALGEIILGVFVIASYFDLVERGWL